MMKTLRTTLALVTALIAFPALANTEGRTTQDRPFVSGGVTQEELADLRTKQPFFNLSLLTAARGSGAYLAAVHVRIVDHQGTLVMEADMDGPYLLVDLTPGSYELQAVYKEETQKRALTMQQGKSQRLVLYFKSDAEVSPDLKQ